MDRISVLIKFIALAIILILLNGCWDARELDELAFVIAAGVDLAGDSDNIFLTAQIIRPDQVRAGGGGGGGGSEGSKQSQTVRVATSTGETIFQAIQNIVPYASRRIYWPHNHIIVFGSDVAKKGLKPLLEFFLRNPEVRPNTFVLITNGKANDILHTEGGIESIAGMGYTKSVRSSSQNAFSPETKLIDLQQQLLSKTTAPIIPIVNFLEEKDFNGDMVKMVKISGTAVLKGDKLIGELDEEESRGVFWVLGKVKRGSIVISSSEGKVSMEIVQSSSKVKPMKESGSFVITVEITVENNLSENQRLQDLISAKGIEELEKQTATVIKEEIEKAIKKSRELNADFFGFGEAIHRDYPKEWEKIETEWDELYPTINIDIRVKTKIGEVGIVANPYRER